MSTTKNSPLLNVPTIPRDYIAREWIPFRLSMNKAQHLAAVDQCAKNAKGCKEAYGRAYYRAALKYGHGAFASTVPGAAIVECVYVSGGTWSHWPDDEKQKVAVHIRAASSWEALAYLHHKAARRHLSTFRALREKWEKEAAAK